MPPRRQLASEPRPPTQGVLVDAYHAAADDEEHEMADVTESLLQTDAGCRCHLAGGRDTSGRGSSAASSADESDATTTALARDKKQGDADGGNVAVDDDLNSVARKLEFDWELYRRKFGSTTYKVTVTHLFVRYVQVVDFLVCNYHCRPPMTLAEREEAAALARTCVLNYLTPVLRRMFSTKEHKLLAHILSTIKLHGSISSGDKGTNELLHGRDKRRYGRTNKDEATFRAQLLRVGQGSVEIKARMAREAAEIYDWFEDGGGEDSSKTPEAPVGGDATGTGRVGGADRRATTLPLPE